MLFLANSSKETKITVNIGSKRTQSPTRECALLFTTFGNPWVREKTKVQNQSTKLIINKLPNILKLNL